MVTSTEEKADYGLTLLETPSEYNYVRPWTYYSQPPNYHLISWYDKRYYRIPLPWMHFALESFSFAPHYNEEENSVKAPYYLNQHYLNFVYASVHPLETLPQLVSAPPLPNFYDGVCPCTPFREGSPIEIITNFWQARFTRDGHLAWHPTWRSIAREAGVSPARRTEVLAYWETLTIDHIMGLYWPISYRIR